jgi:hypothetical protein
MGMFRQMTDAPVEWVVAAEAVKGFLPLCLCMFVVFRSHDLCCLLPAC